MMERERGRDCPRKELPKAVSTAKLYCKVCMYVRDWEREYVCDREGERARDCPRKGLCNAVSTQSVYL